VIVLALLASGCGGSKHATTTVTTPKRAHASSSGGVDLVESTSRGVAGVPASALPGITVLGTGEQSARPDQAVVALSIGPGDSFSPGSGGFSPVEQSEVEPIVAALKKAGADEIAVDRFGQGPYGAQGAAQFTFTVHHVDGVESAISAAQKATRAHTDYNVQSANVVFGLSKCADVEQKAWQTALADAQTRAQRLADLSGVKLGDVLAISEAPFAASPYASATTGCQALLHPTPVNLVLTPSVENDEQKVTIGVTLQVTYAIASK
jgi:uncharacterized protein YggE